jgi:hypothetical protein
MRQIQFLISLLCISLISPTCKRQKDQFNHNAYRLDQSINQNNSVFKFWRGISDSTRKKLIIERVSNEIQTILYNDGIRDEIYKIVDINNDGYKDFVTSYHDFDIIYFFEKKGNKFKELPIEMPDIVNLIDTTNNVFCGYRQAQYAEPYDYSILYTYISYMPHWYYKLVYVTPEGHSGRASVTKIELYRFDNGDYSNPILVREIKETNPENFNYLKFWMQNHKQLIDTL